MRSALGLFLLAACAAGQTCDLSGTPRITAAVNAASLFTGPVAMNTLVSIFGSNFQQPGQSRAVGVEDLADGRSCVAVEIAGRRVPVIYIDPTQINVQAPALAETGDVEVRVIANPGRENERTSEPFRLQIAEFSPAFFKLWPTPCAAAVIAGTAQVTGDPALLPDVLPSYVGDIITLFATGLGVTDPVYQAGEIPGGAAAVTRRVQIEFNGITAPDDHVLYAGLVPGSISGLYQINLRLPVGIRGNSHNTIRLRVGQQLSPGDVTLFVGAR
jgi:uncharacterized protein (TIGR03437 family)